MTREGERGEERRGKVRELELKMEETRLVFEGESGRGVRSVQIGSRILEYGENRESQR